MGGDYSSAWCLLDTDNKEKTSLAVQMTLKTGMSVASEHEKRTAVAKSILLDGSMHLASPELATSPTAPTTATVTLKDDSQSLTNCTDSDELEEANLKASMKLQAFLEAGCTHASTSVSTLIKEVMGNGSIIMLLDSVCRPKQFHCDDEDIFTRLEQARNYTEASTDDTFYKVTHMTIVGTWLVTKTTALLASRQRDKTLKVEAGLLNNTLHGLDAPDAKELIEKMTKAGGSFDLTCPNASRWTHCFAEYLRIGEKSSAGFKQHQKAVLATCSDRCLLLA